MTNYTITINNNKTQFSDYRLKKMLDVKKGVALELRGWHGFLKKIGLGNLQAVKTKQFELKMLWEQLHSDSNSTICNINSDVSCLITFNRMKQLFDLENPVDKPKFKIKETTTNYGFSTNFSFSINDHCIMENPISPICKLLLKEFTGIDGAIRDDINSQMIYAALLNNPIVKLTAVSSIQRAVRRFNHNLTNKQPNPLGYKELINKNPHDGDSGKIVISANKSVFHVPVANLNGASGKFKQVIGKNDQSVLFQSKSKNESTWAFTANEIEGVLIKLNIEDCCLVTHKFSPNEFIARNGGKCDLLKYITKDEKIDINDFEKVLKDIKTLHENGYYHLDIKSENIQVRKTKGIKKLSIIDWDSFSSIERISSNFGTDLFTTGQLSEAVDSAENKDKNLKRKLLQTFDEYAFALTILESRGFNITKRSPLGLDLTNTMTQFIDLHISKGYRQNFYDLVLNPLEYAKNSNGNVYLYDMFNFKSD